MIKDILPDFVLGLSPMDEITTPEYREICKEYGADVVFTEFVSTDALIRELLLMLRSDASLNILTIEFSLNSSNNTIISSHTFFLTSTPQG